MAELFRQYKQMFDNMVEGAFFQSADGTLVDVNPAALEMFGLSRDQFMGRTSYHPGWQVIDSKGKPLLPERHPSMVALRTGRQVRNFVAGIINPQLQRTVWLEITATPLFVKGENTPSQVFVTLHDITAFKQAEKLLQYSEKRYRAIVNTQTEFVDRYLPGGILTFVNDAFCRYWRVKPAELMGKSFFPFIHDDDRQQLIAALDSLTPEKPSIELETRIIFHDGTVHWHSWTHLALFDESGTISEYQSVGRDITERKQMEIALRESEDRYRRFITTANEGIGIADSEFTITYVNDRLADILGYSPEELLGISVASLLPEFEQEILEKKINERKTGVGGSYEYQHRRKNGSLVWLLISSTPILDDAGTFQGCFAMMTDMTERRKAEIALQQAHIDLERRVEERTAELAAANSRVRAMSFELIKAHEQERIRIAAELHDQVGQALLLAKIKLDMLSSEIAAGTAGSRAADIAVQLEKCIQDIRTLTFSIRPPLLDTAGFEAALEWLCQSIRKTYSLELDFSNSCRPFSLNSEMRYSLYQAVRELLLNVAKHAGHCQAWLSLSSEGTALVIRVIDNGVGFELTPGLNGPDSGVCFGLFNVQQRVQQMGGSFLLDSKPGQGTTATLTIPVGA